MRVLQNRIISQNRVSETRQLGLFNFSHQLRAFFVKWDSRLQTLRNGWEPALLIRRLVFLVHSAAYHIEWLYDLSFIFNRYLGRLRPSSSCSIIALKYSWLAFIFSEFKLIERICGDLKKPSSALLSVGSAVSILHISSCFFSPQLSCA